MNKKRIFMVAILLALIIPAFVGVGKVEASYPSFTISAVTKDVSVTILTQDMPKNLDWKLLMGEYNTRGEKGIEVGLIDRLRRPAARIAREKLESVGADR